MEYTAKLNRAIRKNSLLENKIISENDYFVENFSAHLLTLNNLHVCSLEKTIFFNKISLDLSHQPKIFLIFYMLYKNKDDGLDRDMLIKKIYAPSGERISERQMRCYRHNTIKLLSRARIIASECFTSEHFRIEWFPYSSKIKRWYLCRPDIEHFQKNLGSNSHV